MDGMEAPSGRETSQRFSIYAWKPGEGPATASHNDMTNWEQVVEYSGGIDGAVSLDVLKRLTVFYIKQDSGKFLQIANERIDLQNGLFVYSPKAVREGLPYEVIFTGHNSSLVADTHPGEESIAATSLPADPEIAELQQLCTESLNKTNLKPFIPK